MRILIAEDERITRTTLARYLQSWGHEVTAADDGQQAWEAFDGAAGDTAHRAAGDGATGRAAGDTAGFDIVITDWDMPRVSGLELVRRIRGVTRAVYTYVIILTSRSDKADVVSGIEAGADDFVSKPFDRDELRVRLLAGERIVRLERALGQQNAELREAGARIRDGLEAAARVQQSMLPRHSVVTPRVRTAWTYVPTDELCGDAIGLHLVDDRYLVAYVLDVSGHGVPAALLSVSAMHSLEPEPAEMSLLRDLARADGAHADGTHADGAHGDGCLGTLQRPSRVASELNRRFRAGENDGRFLTMTLCMLDTHDGRLRVTSAGHPPPILLRGGEGSILPDAGGLPIAVLDGGEYEEAATRLRPGDRLCLFSDGIIEQTRGATTEQFGTPRLLQSLASLGDRPPAAVVNDVVDELAAWAGSRAFTDDVSLVVVDWLGPEP
jgi:phosphoserine phosphatase RsbU/P